MRYRSVKKRGFTLVELLVVLVVIAILAAIIFPVYARAREQARAVICISNLKQIAEAISMYQQEFDTKIPTNRECGGAGGLPPCIDGDVTLGWVDFIQPYLKNYSVLKCPDDPTTIVPIPAGTPAFSTSAQPGQGFIYDDTVTDYSSTGGANRCSYGKNNNLSNNGLYDAPEPPIKYPTTTILVFDFAPNQGGGDQGEQKSSPFTIDRNGGGSNACASWSQGKPSPANVDSDFLGSLTADQQQDEQSNLSSIRHSEGANYAFVDGHVQWLRPEQIYGECGYNTVLDMGNDGIHPDFRV